MTSLPALSALRAFEAAARLGSFQRAAEEINLTPSAVSYQVRNLEAHLRQALFIRQHRKVVLTEAGLNLSAHASLAFRELERGVAAVQLKRDPHVLRVTAAPAFANAFLTHGVDDFELSAQGVQLQLVVAHSVMDFAADALDVAVRFAPEPPKGLHAEDLMAVAHTAVCTPEIAATLCHGPDALASVTGIYVREHADGWPDWLAGAGLTKPLRELHVETMNVGIQSALDGLGVALAPRAIVAEHLRRGRLVAPFNHDLISRNHYWLVSRESEKDSAKVRTFTRWLRGRVQAAWPVDAT